MYLCQQRVDNDFAGPIIATMTPNDLLKYFGSQTEIARVCKATQPSIFEWFRRGAVPVGRQYYFQALTRGKLKVSPNADRRKKKKTRSK